MIIIFFITVVRLLFLSVSSRRRLLTLFRVLSLALCLLINLGYYGNHTLGWLWAIVYLGGMMVIFTYAIFFSKEAGFQIGRNREAARINNFIYGMIFIIPLWWILLKGEMWGELIFRLEKSPALHFSDSHLLLSLTEIRGFLLLGLFFIIILSLLICLSLLGDKGKSRFAGILS